MNWLIEEKLVAFNRQFGRIRDVVLCAEWRYLIYVQAIKDWQSIANARIL